VSEKTVLPGLAEATVVYFDRFPQSWNTIPILLCKAIAPSARLGLGLKKLSHYGFGGLWRSFAVEIDVVTYVRPVIQRFHDRSGTACGLERFANGPQELQSISDASFFTSQAVGGPVLEFTLSRGASMFVERPQGTDYNVMPVCQP
jgi:hypothetical protein